MFSIHVISRFQLIKYCNLFWYDSMIKTFVLLHSRRHNNLQSLTTWKAITRAERVKDKVKDIINPYNCWKEPIFQSKQAMNKKHHLSLNSQFIVLEGIICFSVQFWFNSLLVLKMRFQVFSFARKTVQGFSSHRKILMSLLTVLFHLQNAVSVFWNFSF